MKIKIIPFEGFYLPPSRKHYNDAGADISLPQKVCIPKNRTARVPLGFGIELPDGLMGLIYPRSSLAEKGILCELPPIDSGYRGEIHAIITNHSGEWVSFEKGQRIGQLVIQPVIMAEFVGDLGVKRDAGAFGSTGE